MAELLLPGSDVPVMEVPHAFGAAKPTAERTQSVVFHPHPFYTYNQALTVPEGATVAEIVAAGGVPEAYHGFLRVWIGDDEIPRHLWHRVRPKAGKQVYVRATPQGGGDGKNILGTILMLVVTVAAAIFAPMIAGALGFAEGTTGFLLAKGVIGAAISLTGALLVSSLIPPPTPGDSGLVGQRALLSGVRNQFQPYADIPRVFGKRRLYPLQAARAYTEAQGKDRYLRVLLCVGWGPLKITDIRIGDTPIANFSNVTYEIREGWATGHSAFGTLPVGKVPDADQTIFTKAVNEETFSILLADAGLDGGNNPIDTPGEWVSRTTDPGVSEISVDVTYPYGLARFLDNSGTAEVTLEVEVQYRAVGSGTWLNVTWDGNDTEDGTQTNGKIIGIDKSRTPTSRGGRFLVPTVGQYEVRMRRITPIKTPTGKYAQRIEWTALRSIKPENPLNMKGLALIALRMKATDQFNGFPDQINCLAESYLPSFDGTNWTWIEGNRNPAWAYADLMRRRGTERLIADSRIDATTIRSWGVACASTAPNASEPYWRFDGTFERGAIFTALRQVASHARASFCISDGKYSVVRDKPQTVPVQHITPRNSFGYQGQKAFVDLPHALKMQFINAALGYQEDEVIVYDDGFTEANASKFESIDLPGCTSATQAWRDGRYYLAVGQLRPETHTVNMDIEHLRCTLGDYVLLSHDVMSVGLGSGRIASRVVGRNILLQTEMLNTASFSKQNGATVTENNSVDPAGGNLADTVVASAVSVFSAVLQPATLVAGVHTFSIYLKAGTSDRASFGAYLLSAAAFANGTAQIIEGPGSISGLNLIVVTGLSATQWTRVSITFTALSSNYYFYMYPDDPALASGLSVVSFGWQVEANATATEYQPNRTAVSIIGQTVGFLLDEAVQMLPGTSYVLRARKNDGTSVLYPLQNVSTATETDGVTLATPVATATAAIGGNLFMFGEAALESAPMIVKKIEPGPDMTAKLTLVDAQPGIWTADTGAIPPFNSYITEQTPIQQQKPPAPNFTLISDETVIERQSDGTLQDRIGVTIATYRSTKVPVATLEVQFRETGTVDFRLASTATIATKQFFIAPVIQGRAYDVRVRAVTEYGVASDWRTTAGHVVVGKTTPPANVTGFTAASRADGVQLSWTANPELDVIGYEIRRGTAWDTAAVVSTLVTGESFFVTLASTGTQNFLIRAVDVIGLKSPSAVTVSSSVSAPADLTFFEVYPQEDYIRATWTPVPGANIEYEIRNGESWATARTVTRASGNSTTVKWPIRTTGSPIFWIKAVSSAGVYSSAAAFTSSEQQPLANRNVILDVDFALDTWAGTRVNMTPVGTGAGSILKVDKGPDGLTRAVADYYRPISLSHSFYARNWIEFLMILTANAGATWNDATYTWANAGDTTWLGSITDTAGTRVKPYIAVQAAGTTPADLFEAFALNGGTTGSNGTTPSTATGVAYGPLHYGQGVTVGSRLAYNLTGGPSAFTFLLDMRFTAPQGTFAPFLLGIPADPYSTGNTPEDVAFGDYTVFRLQTATGFYTLRYLASLDIFRLSVTGQADMDLVVPTETDDLLTFGLAQDATSRTLMAHNIRTGEIYSVTAALAGIGALTAWRNFFDVGDPQSAPATVGGVQLRTTAMSVDAFSNYAPFHAPAGYAPFKELVPGDFSYQNALIWISLVNSDPSLDVQIAAAKLRVDVPDIINRGEVTVGTGGFTVVYATPYKVLPDVQVTQTSGTLAIPKVTGRTVVGFTVQLFDVTSPTTAVAGTVSYTAAGY